MATRFYLSRTLTGLSLTPQGAWDDATVTRGSLSKTKDTNVSTFVQRAETNADPAWDVSGLQLISAPLDTAQTISGTFDLVAALNESAADADMFLHVHLWVSQGDTSTPRGTLLTDVIDVTELPTTAQGVQLPQQTLSSVAASVGDRIVLELGYRATNTLTASRNGRFYFGGNAATDLSSGDTDTTHPGWCEFGTTITDGETRVNWQEQWYPGGSTQTATATPPAVRGGWTVTSSIGAALSLRTSTPGVASAFISLLTGTTAQNATRLLRQFVSPPLNAGLIPASDEKITGIVSEQAADQDDVWCQYAYLMKPNGDVRTVLLDLAADPDTDNEWPTTAAGRESDAFPVAETTIVQDDRLVIEMGVKQLGTPAANGTVNARHGGTGADAQVGDTDTTKPTWLIFAAAAAAASRNQGAVWVGL